MSSKLYPKTNKDLKIAVNEWCKNKDYIYEPVLNKYIFLEYYKYN